MLKEKSELKNNVENQINFSSKKIQIKRRDFLGVKSCKVKIQNMSIIFTLKYTNRSKRHQHAGFLRLRYNSRNWLWSLRYFPLKLGFVFEAQHKSTKKKAALKRVEKSSGIISREFEIVQLIQGSPNVVKL